MEQVVSDERVPKMPLLTWWLILIDGIFVTNLGILLLVSPQSTLTLLIIFLGAYWFVTGIFQFAGAFMHIEHRVANIFMGLLGLAAGAILLVNPLMGDVIIPGMIVIILGAEGILMGAAAMFQAFKGAGAGRFIFGLFSMAIGLILLLNQPFAIGVTALPFAIGLFALFIGPAVIVASFRVRKIQQAS
ncbi:MAG: DUF308 domain-containing protein [Actinomycetota bacterium]